MQKGTVLVTGGAGYIGSHIVLALLDAGCEVVVVDDLSTGSRNLLPEAATCIEADCADANAMDAVFARHDIQAVVHAAASTSVPESVAMPQKYYANNVTASLNLIDCALNHRVERLVFSSSSAVYGAAAGALGEDALLQPLSPYGRSKLMTEMMLRDISSASGLRCVCLRYFNVCGADGNLRTGDPKADSGGLIKRVLQCALGERASLEIFGTDYQTPDGTAVRDYIHVSDIARANVLALEYAQGQPDDKAFSAFNLGLGQGTSIRQIVQTVEKVAGVSLETFDRPRRPGDPDLSLADTSLARSELGFVPEFDSLDQLISDALAWERKLRSS